MKALKIWSIVAGIMLFTGVILVGAGVAMGERGNYNGRFIKVNISGWSEDYKFTKDIEEAVTGIDISAENMSVEIIQENIANIRLEYESGSSDVMPAIECRDGILYIKQQTENKLLNINFGLLGGEELLKVYIPADADINDVTVDTKNGKVDIGSGMSVGKLKVKTNNGAILADNVKVTERTELVTSNGKIECNGEFYKYTYIKTSNGAVSIAGKYYDEIIVNTSNGKIEADMALSEREYDIDADTGNGIIKINGDKSSGSIIRERGKDNKLKLKTGNGSIDIKF